MNEADEFYDLARDFQESGAQVGSVIYDVFKQGGQAFADDWRRNAKETSGRHGKHYPDSITSDTRLAFGVEVETGPENGRRQGRMGRGFEFGSVKQPPHLDGLHALPAAIRRIDRASDAALGFLLP